MMDQYNFRNKDSCIKFKLAFTDASKTENGRLNHIKKAKQIGGLSRIVSIFISYRLINVLTVQVKNARTFK